VLDAELIGVSAARVGQPRSCENGKRGTGTGTWRRVAGRRFAVPEPVPLKGSFYFLIQLERTRCKLVAVVVCSHGAAGDRYRAAGGMGRPAGELARNQSPSSSASLFFCQGSATIYHLPDKLLAATELFAAGYDILFKLLGAISCREQVAHLQAECATTC